MFHLRRDQFLSLALLSGLALVHPGVDAITQLDLPLRPGIHQTEQLPNVKTSLTVPIFTGTTETKKELENLTANEIYVMDRGSGAVLYEKDAHAGWYPASVAKMMTALVSRRFYALDDTVTVHEEAYSTGSVIGFHYGEVLSVKNVLTALLVQSGNDAAFILANHFPTQYTGFVEAMNTVAKEMGLEKTTFLNASGLDVAGQQTTARDLALIANQVMKDEFLRSLVSQKTAVIHDETGALTHSLTNTNELLGAVDGVVGIKTGTTALAGENLVLEVDRAGHQVIIVVLGSKDRFGETRKIIDWVEQNYEWRTFHGTEEVVKLQ